MEWITSPREKRLWLWALAVLAAIFMTLFLGGSMTALVSDGTISTVLFAAGFLLVITTIMTQGLTLRPSGRELFIALGLAACYLLLFTRLTLLAERSHLVEFGVLSVFIYEALIERRAHGRAVPLPALMAVLAASLVGVVDESLQAFLPQRVFDAQDLLFNLLAAAMAVGSSVALEFVRSRCGRGVNSDE